MGDTEPGCLIPKALVDGKSITGDRPDDNAAAWARLADSAPGRGLSRCAWHDRRAWPRIATIVNNTPLAILVDELNPKPTGAQPLAAAWSNADSHFPINDLDPNRMAALIAAEGSGFLPREAEASDLTRALIAVGRGELALFSELAGQVLRQLAALR